MISLSECWWVQKPSRMGPLWFNSCPLNVCILCGWLWRFSYTLFILDTLFAIELKRLLVTGKYSLFPLSSDDSFQFRQVHVTVAVVFKLIAIFSTSNRPIEVQSQLEKILNKNVLQNMKEENQIALTCCSQRKVFTPAPGHIILTQGSHYLLLLGQEESSDSLGQCCFCFVFKLSNFIILGVYWEIFHTHLQSHFYPTDYDVH